jgi:signal transduction histidine kinase
VRVHQDVMTVELLDDGVGLTGGAIRTGTGLRNTRERLAHLYGDVARLEIMSRPTGGTLVRVTLPFRREPDPLAAVEGDAASDATMAHAGGST